MRIRSVPRTTRQDGGRTDCVSFVVMQERGLQEALTTDRDFEQAGLPHCCGREEGDGDASLMSH